MILGPSGPIVIDWANAARGPAALDPALVIAIGITAKANVGTEGRASIDAFIDAFRSHFGAADIDEALPLALKLRAADRNVTDSERAELDAFER